MKAWVTIMTLLAVAALVASCKNKSREQSKNDAEARYLDLSTGEAIELEKDPGTGAWINAETGEEVDIYVDTKTADTIWGKDGTVINGRVRHEEDGRYVYMDADMNSGSRTERNGSGSDAGSETGTGNTKVVRTGDEYKIKHGDYKKEVEKDGDITIKNGDVKIKIDGKTGERKVKRD
jgi:hypothetical protein